MEKLLPGVWSYCITEQSVVSTLFQAIGPSILLIRIANRQISNRGQCIVDNGVVTNGRSYHFIPSAAKSTKELLEMFLLQNHLISDLKIDIVIGSCHRTSVLLALISPTP